MARRAKPIATTPPKAVNWRSPGLKNVKLPTAPGTTYPTAPTTGSRPLGCPPAIFVETQLVQLETTSAATTDSDTRARAIDNFNAVVHTGCTTPAQNDRLLKLASGLSKQAGAEAKSFDGIIEKIIAGILPILKIGAGGIGVIVTGLALVYVAGRNTPVPGAAKAAVKVANPAAGAISKAAKTSERGQARSIAKKQARSEKTERARSRVVSSGGKVRVSSKAEGADARAAGAEYDSGKGQRTRERLIDLRNESSRRRKAPDLHSKERVL